MPRSNGQIKDEPDLKAMPVIAVSSSAMKRTSLHLGEMNGVAYYTVEGHGYDVVATLASQGGTPVRFESTLLPGQKIVVSIPGSAGAKAQMVEFAREGDRLLVETSPVQAE